MNKFRNGKKIKKLKDPRKIHFFQILQQFDLIRAGAAGKFRLTVKGKNALNIGVNNISPLCD